MFGGGRPMKKVLCVCLGVLLVLVGVGGCAPQAKFSDLGTNACPLTSDKTVDRSADEPRSMQQPVTELVFTCSDDLRIEMQVRKSDECFVGERQALVQNGVPSWYGDKPISDRSKGRGILSENIFCLTDDDLATMRHGGYSRMVRR